jgi:nitroreductase
MTTFDAIRSRRSIRSFAQTPVPRESLERMLEAARLSPTAGNRQPLRFLAVRAPALCREIFPQTRWAGLLPKPLGKPQPGREPTAYFVLLVDRAIAPEPEKARVDVGAAGMSVILQAQSEGIASCWLGAINRSGLAQTLGIDLDAFAIDSIIALGYPDMRAYAVDMAPGAEDIAYFIDDDGGFAVPKRNAETVCRIIE